MIPAAGTLPVQSPADGRLLDTLPLVSPEHIPGVLEQARSAQREWSRTSWEDRRGVLRRAREEILQRALEIARLIASEQGKPWVEALTMEVTPTCEHLSHLISYGERLLRPRSLPHRLPFLAGKSARLELDPAGVVAIIPAWNFPFTVPACQAAAALVAGNAVVLRPSTSTLLSARILTEVFRAAGLPGSLLQLLVCRSQEAEALVTHPGVDRIVFTGSVPVGRRIMELASRGPARVVLELGAKDPMIVFADADLERAARGAVWGAFANAGQICSSTERVYVQQPVLEAFCERVIDQARRLRLGHPLQDGVEMGPMTTRAGLETVRQHVAEAVERGARVLAGGRNPGGQFFEPTVLRGVTHEMRVMTEETFGPVLPVMGFRDEEEALRLANDTPYGLTASVWTADPERARRVASGLRTGAVTVNDLNFTFAEGEFPWGGPGWTGRGRTHGLFGLLEMVEAKVVSEDWTRHRRQPYWFPYDDPMRRLMVASLPALYGANPARRAAGAAALVGHLPYLRRNSDLASILKHLPRRLLGHR